mmetsp:Transcript_143358/g.248088  ORF Transcript_143358/g.248088 Transcript_143358/m.248088 type:complete len:139 (-) Transcript_143358:131-547(-)
MLTQVEAVTAFVPELRLPQEHLAGLNEGPFLAGRPKSDTLRRGSASLVEEVMQYRLKELQDIKRRIRNVSSEQERQRSPFLYGGYAGGSMSVPVPPGHFPQRSPPNSAYEPQASTSMLSWAFPVSMLGCCSARTSKVR